MKKILLFAPIFLLIFAALHAQQAKLDPTNFIVMGGGLSAGFADFRLGENSQQNSYPVFMARQMGTIMPVPTVREDANPGILIAPGTLIAFDPVPDILPRVRQSGTRALPFPFFAFNLSVPFLRVSESLNRRPQPVAGADKPLLVQEGDLKQSLINMLLGFPYFFLDSPVPRLAQVEYAETMNPTFIIVELGFGDVIDTALSGGTAQVTSVESFTADYTKLVSRLQKTFATVLLMNAPDPTDTAYFSSVQEVAQLYRIDSATLSAQFGLQSGDFVTVSGLVEIADRLRGRRTGSLSSRAVLRASVAASIQNAVRGYNSAIASVGSSNNLRVFDLNAFTKEVRAAGVQAGSFRLKGGYRQGFYSQDGLFPSPTGHAVLANRLLQFLNSSYGTNYSPVDVDAVAKRDDLVPKPGDGVSPTVAAKQRREAVGIP